MLSDTKAKLIASAARVQAKILIVQDAIYVEPDQEKEKLLAQELKKKEIELFRQHMGSPFLPGFGKVTGNDVEFPYAEEKAPAAPKTKVEKKAKREGVTAFSDGRDVKKGTKKKTVQDGPTLFEMEEA